MGIGSKERGIMSFVFWLSADRLVSPRAAAIFHAHRIIPDHYPHIIPTVEYAKQVIPSEALGLVERYMGKIMHG